MSDPVSLSLFFNSRVWGFALARAWVYIMFLGVGVNTITITGEAVPSEVYLVSSFALTTTLLMGFLAHKTIERALRTAHVRWAGALLTAVGTLCITLLVAADVPLLVIAIAGGVTTGVGSGLLDLGYGEIYRNRPPSEVGIEIPMAALIAAIIYIVTDGLSSLTAIVITVLLPLGSGVIMAAQRHVWEPSRTFKAEPLVFPAASIILRIGVCAGGIGLVDGVTRYVFIASSGLSSYDFYHPAMLESSIAMTVLLIGFILFRRGNAFRDLYKLITFIIAASILLFPSFVGNGALGSSFILVGYNTFNVFIWILLADLAYNSRLSSAAVFGLGWGMLTAGTTVGQLMGAELSAVVALTPQVVSFTSAVGGLVVFALCLFVLRGDDLVDTRKLQLAISPNDESDEEEGEVPSEAGVAKDDGASGEGEDEAGGEGEGARRVPFRARCLQLAKNSGLTPRETEILMLFARGRSSARIQEELFISRGTVTTHLQHIYRKAGVHSKQELLDLIEATETEDFAGA